MNKFLYIDNNPNNGFKWSVMAEHGVIWIKQDELFARPEFEDMTNGQKIIYAFDLGWRYSTDKMMWHRIRGY